MSDYAQVKDSLKRGVEPSLICTTFPWDRLCITPPEMSEDQISGLIEKSGEKSVNSNSDERDGIFATLLTTMVFAGKDLSSHTCPVLVARMRSSRGRDIVDSVRVQMQGWDDNRI